MKVRAIAARDTRCNAVGTVELECRAEGLRLVHVGVSAFREGYAPGSPSQRTELCVPWGSVRTASVEDDQLFLAIDPELSPLNRMTLRHFSSGLSLDHRELYRRRLILRVAVIAGMLVSALLAWVIAPRIGAAQPAFVALVLAVLAAGLLLVLGLASDRWWPGSAASVRDRLAFFAELALYVPALASQPRRPTPTRDPLGWAAERLMPRSTTVIVITLSASSLAALLTGKWLFDRAPAPAVPAAVAPAPPAVPLPTQPSTPAQQAPPPAPVEEARSAPPEPVANTAVVRSGECNCAQTECILWRNPLPRLSPLLIEQNVRPHNDHTHLDLELGVVNNGKEPLREITLNLRFFEDGRGAKKERVAKKSQPLYFEGPLQPGHAIKWHVEGRGTSFEVDNPRPEPLQPAEMAPPENFHDLLSTANHRPVRLHGAMMLAALGDEQRAREGVLALRDALREEEAPYLDRLLSATGPIAVCQLAVSEGGAVRQVQACVHNRSSEDRASITVRVRALDRLFDHRSPVAPPPIVLAELHSRLPETLPSGKGRFFAFDLDTSNPDRLKPETFEVLFDDLD